METVEIVERSLGADLIPDLPAVSRVMGRTN
jgi:hypothetical protein